MPLARTLRTSLERTIYVIAGLPIALRGAALAPTPEARLIRKAFSRRYWHPASLREAIELAVGLILVPLAVPLAALWFTARNGPVIRQREGKGLCRQFVEQIRLYGAAGIVGPWYYIFSLHRDGERRARTFLQRCETKRGIYALLKGRNPSPIGDKKAFASACAAAGIRSAGAELVIGEADISPDMLPDCDLFVKPLQGCGGRGAERWDRADVRTWSSGQVSLGPSGLLQELRSRGQPLIVQRLVTPHPMLQELTAGALPTVRALTILSEAGNPEVVATVFRMSIGANRTVDNIHAGGLACAVSLDDGSLGSASDLGSNARLGWHDRHPDTGALIKGVKLPYWDEVKAIAERAHRAFIDRTIIGWDIAIARDGPIIIEGNRGPDMDLMQRFMETGFCLHHRFGDLIAHHLKARGYGVDEAIAPDGSPVTAGPGALGDIAVP